MIRILSEEHIQPNEVEILCWLLDSGLDYYHLRKVGEEREECINLLHQIPDMYRSRVVVHHDVSLHGFLYHHKSIERQQKSMQMHSCSAHQVEEVKTYLEYYNNVFWSPVFDSISKKGYLQNTTIDLSDFNPNLKKKVIALGGIQPSTFKVLKQMGFSQIAIKGWFWNQSDYKQAWKEIRTTWQELEKKY